jgi:RNA polymerase sigma-70 factor (TIGR02960 family)
VTDEADFRALTEPLRRELELHCYRLLGSVQDAEDLVQETFLAAWRSFDEFEGRSSVRTWLYKIATNRCLNALRDHRRRPVTLPDDPPEPTRMGEPLWLQPHPDDPDERYEVRGALGLAFVAGLQHLPPTQRAALVLKDVLGYPAKEVAEMLDTSPVAINSGLQRARTALEARSTSQERAPAPRSATERRIVARFADAFEAGDVDAIVSLLTEDAWFTMPPVPLEYQGHAAIAEFLRRVPAGGELQRFRFIATRANGQPAFGSYLKDPQCPIAHGIGVLVLTLAGDRISALTMFHDTGMMARFGLPRTIPYEQAVELHGGERSTADARQ